MESFGWADAEQRAAIKRAAAHLELPDRRPPGSTYHPVTLIEVRSRSRSRSLGVLR